MENTTDFKVKDDIFEKEITKIAERTADNTEFSIKTHKDEYVR